MKQVAKKTLIKILDPLFTRLGYKKEEVNSHALLSNFYEIVKNSGFKPQHIVDVGANHGNWTRIALEYFPDAYYTLLEPQSWLKDFFKDLLDDNPKIKFHGVGAGAKAGKFKFTIAARDDSSSFRLTETEAANAGYKQVEIPVVTLNELLDDSDFPQPDIIKIDAEGLDIDVLQGAGRYLGSTEIIMVEAGVVAKDFDNTLLKMLTFMDSKGYKLFDFTDLNRPFRSKILWLVELAFVKKDGAIASYPHRT